MQWALAALSTWAGAATATMLVGAAFVGYSFIDTEPVAQKADVTARATADVRATDIGTHDEAPASGAEDHVDASGVDRRRSDGQSHSGADTHGQASTRPDTAGHAGGAPRPIATASKPAPLPIGAPAIQQPRPAGKVSIGVALGRTGRRTAFGLQEMRRSETKLRARLQQATSDSMQRQLYGQLAETLYELAMETRSRGDVWNAAISWRSEHRLMASLVGDSAARARIDSLERMLGHTSEAAPAGTTTISTTP